MSRAGEALGWGLLGLSLQGYGQSQLRDPSVQRFLGRGIIDWEIPRVGFPGIHGWWAFKGGSRPAQRVCGGRCSEGLLPPSEARDNKLFAWDISYIQVHAESTSLWVKLIQGAAPDPLRLKVPFKAPLKETSDPIGLERQGEGDQRGLSGAQYGVHDGGAP